MNLKSLQPAPTSPSGDELKTKGPDFLRRNYILEFSSSVFSWRKENQQSKLSKWMWKKKDIFLFSFIYCLHVSFEDVSSTVIAAIENSVEGGWRSWFFF